MGFDVEVANALHLFVEEFNAVGVLLAERENIYDAAAYGELARGGNKIHAFELVFKKRFVEEVNAEVFADVNFKGIGFQFFFGHHFLK